MKITLSLMTAMRVEGELSPQFDASILYEGPAFTGVAEAVVLNQGQSCIGVAII